MSPTLADPNSAQVEALLRAMVGCRVAVVGDVVLDEYSTGKVGRISPEAPVPVFQVEQTQQLLGGAANVGKCLVALGAAVDLCGVVGRDGPAEVLRDKATSLGMDVAGLLCDRSRPTTTKGRIVAQQQQMLRIDREDTGPVERVIEQRLIRRVESAIRRADAVILSDYSKGVLTRAVCGAALKAAGQKPLIVDPKQLPWTRFRGATLIKPNRPEASWFSGLEVADDAGALHVARTIAKKLGIKNVLITRGESGMTLAYRGGSGRLLGRQLRPWPREVFDATGCGDVVAAVLALALAARAPVPLAAFVANVAGGVEVTKFGATVVSDTEILEALGGAAARCESKIISLAAAASLADELRHRGRKVVFTNGCFDVLHVGHVSYLEQSRQRGDALIVGINTDASVRRIKGQGRPVQPAHDRARIIASQACVDAVVLFDEDTPIKLVKAVRPDVLTKGSDYRRKQDVVGWDLVRRWGGRVDLIDLVRGRSTTRLLARASRGPGTRSARS